MMFHFLRETVPIEPVIAFAGKRFEKFRREPVRLVHFKGVGARHGRAFFRLHRLKDAVQAAQTVVDAAHEPIFFSRNDALNAFNRPLKFRIRFFHEVGDDRNKLEEERLLHAHLHAVKDGAAQQAANDVFLFFRTRIDVFVNGKRTGANVIRNAAQAAAVFVLKVDGVIFLRADFCGGLDERAQRIDMEVRFYALQDGRNALEPHAGVDIFARERAKVVRRVADAVELRKDEVPNFDFALRGLMIDFGTRAAYSVWSLARRGGGAEVFVFVEILKFSAGSLISSSQIFAASWSSL